MKNVIILSLLLLLAVACKSECKSGEPVEAAPVVKPTIEEVTPVIEELEIEEVTE